jgi:hypothetical protein
MNRIDCTTIPSWVFGELEVKELNARFTGRFDEANYWAELRFQLYQGWMVRAGELRGLL